MNRYIKDYIENKYSTSNYIQKLKATYKKDFQTQKKERVSYQKKGSRLIVKGYNKKGKLTNKAVYIKRTGKAAARLSKDYKKAVNDEREGLEKLNAAD